MRNREKEENFNITEEEYDAIEDMMFTNMSQDEIEDEYEKHIPDDK